MKNLIIALTISLLFAACAVYEPVPEGYQGATALISDSFSNKQPASAHFFLLERIDGKDIASSWMASRAASMGTRVTEFTPKMLSRSVLPEKQTFTLVGIIFFASEAQSRFADERSVQRELTFRPMPGETYTVRGEIGPSGSEVWLEDSSGHKVKDSE